MTDLVERMRNASLLPHGLDLHKELLDEGAHELEKRVSGTTKADTKPAETKPADPTTAAAAQIAAYHAENKELWDALRAIDAVAVSHPKGAAEQMQKIARAAMEVKLKNDSKP